MQGTSKRTLQRFSPDGKHVAYSVWTRGGYRDIRIVEVATGKFRQLMRDRAMDMQPSYSSDGKYLFFTSDRTGIANVYAHELANGKLHQVTNVRTGAYMPELSPDGTTLVYVGYTSYGYDLFGMKFDPSQFLEPLAYTPDRPQYPIEPPRKQWDATGPTTRCRHFVHGRSHSSMGPVPTGRP